MIDRLVGEGVPKGYSVPGPRAGVGGGGGGPVPVVPPNLRPRLPVRVIASAGSLAFIGLAVCAEAGRQLAVLGLTVCFPDGTALTDQVHNATVLCYASPGVAFPATVEIMTAAGDSLAKYGEFNNLA